MSTNVVEYIPNQTKGIGSRLTKLMISPLRNIVTQVFPYQKLMASVCRWYKFSTNLNFLLNGYILVPSSDVFFKLKLTHL